MPKPPIADRRDHVISHHEISINDPYYWLKDQSYPAIDDEDVLAYLHAENDYFNAIMEPLQPQVEELFEEIKARQVQDESSVPYRDGRFMYQARFIPGKQYRQFVRWRAGIQDDKQSLQPPAEGVQVVLDENVLAEGLDYFRRSGFALDPTQTLLAFGIDDDGSEQFTLRVLNVETGVYLSEAMTNTTGEVVWSSDSKSLFYVVNTDNWRPYRVLRHVLGTDVRLDEVVYEEDDDGFFVGIDQSTSREYLLLSTASNVTSEVRVLSLATPTEVPTLIAERRDQHEYDLDHHRNRFIVRTNDRHKNFRMAFADDQTPTEAHWQPLIEPSDARYITGMRSFDSQLVIAARENGLEQILIADADGAVQSIPFDEAAYSLNLGSNHEPDPDYLRIEYSSLATPETTFDFDFETGELRSRKVQVVPSGHNPKDYVTERIFVEARDGARVPVSIIYAKNTQIDGSAPLYLYGYGAYGASMDPYFRTTILSLINRGFIFAIAHIRGGAELGFSWYEDGKLAKRTNTFNDFVAVARDMIERNYTAKGRIAIMGGSAGGSLMGAAVNQAPELWGAVAAHVPFVDILNTMVDTSLPLTPLEWPEWGNPIEDKTVFEYIRSYSPYDQTQAMRYPPMLVTAGLNDPRVTYWEPAKWVAKIRHLKEDDNILLLKTEMSAGHGGKSGRYDSLREVAEEYAFILDVMNLSK